MSSNNIKEIFVINPKLKEITLSCIERIARIHSQIQSIANIALQKDSSDTKTTYLTNCLKEVLRALIHSIALYSDAMDTELEGKKQIKNIRNLFAALIKLREELAILPKQEEPIELYRFLRIFNRDGIATTEEDDIKFVLYTAPDGEVSTYSTYENTPLEEYETKVLKVALERIYKSTPDNIPQDGGFSYHIRIRREVTETPLFWPILAHEIGHQVMRLPLFEKRYIQNAFSKYLGKTDTANKYHPSFNQLLDKINLKYGSPPLDSEGKIDTDEIFRSWLTECWCDIYAYFATGPAFIFAQRNAMFIENINNDSDIGSYIHPPAYLRLLVLQAISINFQDKFSDTNGISIDPLDSSLCEDLLHQGEGIPDLIYDVAQWLIDFFNSHFKMLDSDTLNLHAHITKLKECSTVFTVQSLEKLIERIDKGYPIPSVSIDSDSFEERETSVHEIMMAAWISHDNNLTSEVVDLFSENFEECRISEIDNQWNFFTSEIAPIYERFNQAVLRSLQISEWVSLLKPSHEEKQNKVRSLNSEFSCVECFNCDTTLLVDHEIKKLLKSEQLKVIPLIHLESQLGSTSLDVRLGPTFQTYQPNQSGVVDFTDDISVKNVHANSTIVDLDFTQGIVLAPGQFVLAHTMEYIGLPENVAAQIEGRSSFARLGIQIHMTANLIDPGFHGSITFEIFNAGPNPIRLFPGYRIGQLRFFLCKKPDKPYNKKKNAKYKGLLVYSNSLLTNDYEIERIKQIRN